MGTQMDRLVEEHFKELKKRCSLTALDENSKKVEKRKSLDCNLLTGVKGMKSLAEPRSWDLKSVKVLVERTKFNEMQVVDLDRNTHSPIKIPNGRLHKTPQNRRRSAKKKPALAAAPQRQCLDEHFKARRCYVKVSKDKQLMKLLHSEPVPDEQKRTRGRPKKQKKVEVADEEPSTAASTTEHAVPALSTSNNLKRKHTDTTDAGIQSKRARKNKSSEFFINIDSLICSPSPRRKSIKSNIPEETKRRGRRSGTLVSLVTLRHKFGNRYFRSFVKVKRHREKERPAVDETPVEGEMKKKKKGKNLSVSFLETVEIFGESSEGEDWPDYDEPSFSGKASRLKRLDNGALVEDDFAKCSATSTPFTASRTSQSSDESVSSPNKPDGILKRKEKISFSPLKEDDPSPRKEQLKLANEKIVRLSFEQQPAEEEEPETVSPSSRQNTTESQLTTAKDADTALQEEEEEGEVETQEETQTVANTSQDPEPVELETELITPPPSEDKNEENPETTERDDDVVPTEAEVEAESEVDNEKEVEEERQTGEEEQQRDEENEENLENKTNLEEDTTQTNTNDEISRTLSENDKEGVDSFESAVDVPNAEENSASEGDATKDKPLELIVNDVDEGKVEDASTDVDLIEEPSIESPNTTEANSSRTKADNDEEDLISETTNQVNISNSSDQQFEDASELIATVPLTEPVEPDQTDVDAVLNDVCQLVVGVNSTLLSEHNHDEFESPHNVPTVIGDDVDDFTSVLTHPEVERSLQSAASSTLVPNSQEIVVAAAVSSQAAMVPPSDVDVTEDTFARVVAEVERFAKDVNPEIYSESVGITGTDVMMDNVQARHSLDDIFDDDVDGQSRMFLQFPDDIISTLRMSSGSIDICHDKSLPIQVIETEVMAIPNEPDMIFDKPLGTTASILGTSMNSANDTLNTGCGHSSTADASSKLSLGRIFQSVKSYVMSPKDKHTALKD